ncbi:MAG: cell wall-binding repeat-containing protein [Eubacteriaceae bacterium]
MKNKVCLIFTLAIMVVLMLISPVSALSIEEKEKDVFEDQNVIVKEQLENEAQEVFDSINESKNENMTTLAITPSFTVAIANTDGSFHNVSTFNNFTDAKNSMNTNSNENAVVLNDNRSIGNQVVAMKDGIVRLAGEKKGKAVVTFGNTYVNNGNAAYYYDSSGSTVKIGISGEVSTVNDTSIDGKKVYGIELVELIPRAHVTHQSYYTKNSNKELVHYVAMYKYDGKDKEWKWVYETFTICQAPSFMSEGTKYYSMDGQKFYSDNKLVNLKGTFYPYYKFLTFRSKTSYTTQQLNSYIASWNKSDSVLNGRGSAFINAQNEFGVNAALLLAFAVHESGYGTSPIAKDKNNLFGVNATDSNPYGNANTYNSVEDSIYSQADCVISRAYTDAILDSRYFGANVGNKNAGMNVKYASDPYWGEKIAGHMYRLDKYLGNKDNNKYQLALSNSVTYARTQASTSAKSVYKLAVKEYSYPAGIPVLIVNSSNGWYKIQSDMGMDTNGVAKYDYKYNYKISKAYVKASDFTLINNSSQCKDPADEGMYLKGISLSTGSVSPSFSNYNTNYTVNVDNLKYQITVSPNLDEAATSYKLKNSDGSVISNPVNLNVGTNVIDIEVTNKDGSQQNYKVTIKRSMNINISTGLKRLSGSNRWDTSSLIADYGWAVTNSIVLASGVNFPDALAAAPFAFKIDAPLILTEKGSIPKETMDTINKLKPKTIYVLGGPIAIKDSVVNQLKSNGYTVERVYGTNRFGTAVAIGNQLRQRTQFTTAILAYGMNYPDALSVNSVASSNGYPVLFTEKESLPEETKNALKSWGIKNVKVVGGTLVVRENVVNELKSMGISVERIYGSNRINTSLAIANRFYPTSTGVIISTGFKYTDALSGGPFAAKANQPILLVEKDKVSQGVLDYIKNNKVNKVTILGGPLAVSENVKKQIENAMTK